MSFPFGNPFGGKHQQKPKPLALDSTIRSRVDNSNMIFDPSSYDHLKNYWGHALGKK